ncbi:MAG: 23S rRNA (adenine(2503)-C(2))-methyltransferase RlmN [Deltaproteobacteria bacterium]|nr:23S rRNA (adenine(2503)-C(2))-methyltransferase RlmN [Deltaproteobacteria bacterium]MBW2133971.1 23S rRNA (adenine(2503)-C(2))-methyltransferase RlmN [Deltaproteobacteria bacterium]
MTSLVDLKEFTQDELERLVASWGQPPYRARQLQKWLYKGIFDFEQMTDLSKDFRHQLARKAMISRLTLADQQHSEDGSEKFGFALADGRRIESVLIPEDDHLTLCLSTQVGCAQGCHFCLTAQQGLTRNLTAAEIVNQVLEVRARLRQDQKLSNLVFMGMGEPLANFNNTLKALTILTASWGLDFSARRVTVSTVGLAPQIIQLGNAIRVNLAVSLNAPDDPTRSRLMPVNRCYPLAVLLDACRAFPLPGHRRITFTYVLLKGINDSPTQARQLARLLRGLRAKINLIPFNPHPSLPFERPSEAAILAFQEILLSAHYTTLIRKTRGLDIVAACGQLAGTAPVSKQNLSPLRANPATL